MRTIKAKIIAGIVGCAILTTVLLGYLSITNSTASARQDAQTRMADECSLQGEKVEGLIGRIEQSVDTLAEIVMDSLDAEKLKEGVSYEMAFTQSLTTTVRNFAEHTDGTVSAYIRYNPDFSRPTSGIYLSRETVEDSFMALTPTDFSMFEKDDFAHVGWYYVPVNNGGPTWMDPYLNENNNVYLMSYVVPVFAEGENIGIIGMDLLESTITDIVAQTQVYDSGYAFLLDTDGDILYHKELPTGEKFAEINGGAYADLAAEILNEERDGIIFSYELNGEEKSLVSRTLTNGMHLVLTAPNAEINASADELKASIGNFAFIIVIMVIIVGVGLGISISSPIKKITETIKQTADYDFRTSVQVEKLCKNKDEIGIMAQAVQQMRDGLSEMAGKMKMVESSIMDNMGTLDGVMKEMNAIAEDNSATTQQMAAGMEETSANTLTIAGNVEEVKHNSSEIFKLAKEGMENSEQVLGRAEKLGKTTEVSSDKTMKVLGEMQQKSSAAIERSKAVAKINELTENIKNISSQTNLLALNANIEAARAGDAGRGFAVVATEIGNLANQTFQTVEDINGIVGEVNEAVANMTDCIRMIMEFMEGTVMVDYNSFRSVGSQYQQDANTMKEIVTGISGAMEELNMRIMDIAKAIDEIGITVEQSSEGVNMIAQKSGQTVEKTNEGYQQLEESKKSIEVLKQVLAEFTVE